LRGDSLPIDDLLSIATETVGLPGTLRALGLPESAALSVGELITRIVAGMTIAQVQEAKRILCQTVGASQEELRSASQLFLAGDRLAAMESVGMEIGNHTSSHIFLRALAPSELQAEVADARTELARLSGKSVDYFSIPYGNLRDGTPGVLDVVRKTGHKATFLVHAKSNLFRPSADIYYRVSPGAAKAESLPWMLSAAPRMRTVRDFVRGA